MNRLLICLVLSCGAAARADELSEPKVSHDRLGAPTLVLDGEAPIDVSSAHATPFVVDWNGDGKQDLLVGQFRRGKLRIYLNQGTDGEPKFEGFSYLQAGGADASVPVA